MQVIFICNTCKEEISKEDTFIEVHWTTWWNKEKVAFYCSKPCKNKD